jgi:hypothetical protein
VPETLPSGASLTLTATLASTIPPMGAGIALPLRVALQDQPTVIWTGAQIEFAGNESVGSVVIDAQIFQGLPTASQLTWTGSLGGTTRSVVVTVA